MIVNSIASTTTSTGLEVYARLDEGDYPKVEVTDAELAAVNTARDAFHPEWNYTRSGVVARKRRIAPRIVGPSPPLEVRTVPLRLLEALDCGRRLDWSRHVARESGLADGWR